jgi:exopolyphosphatase/guanosine-5'-triphosphate,3'-diphosphate pyrophosphatase
MRKAVIDLGTNTFNLLVADLHDGTFTVVHTEKDGVALGMGGINQGYLSDDAFNRGINALRHFRSKCDELNVSEIHAIGTSALRSAANSAEFIAESEKLGIDIEIVSGLREAELIYHGVKWSYDFKEPGVIMDIGGGSTEFIFADLQGVQDMISLNIGVSRIYQKFKTADPLSDEDIQHIEDWLEIQADGFFDYKHTDLLIGASGTFETFYELIQCEPFPELIRSIEVPFDELMKNLDGIIASTQEERNRNPWIVPIRKKMAPIAAVKTRWIIRKLGVSRTLISPCSLKEGALY